MLLAFPVDVGGVSPEDQAGRQRLLTQVTLEDFARAEQRMEAEYTEFLRAQTVESRACFPSHPFATTQRCEPDLKGKRAPKSSSGWYKLALEKLNPFESGSWSFSKSTNFSIRWGWAHPG